MSEMRTPLSKVRGLGSAKSGTGHFWKQRMTALANVPLLLAFVWVMLGLAGRDYAYVVETLSYPLVALLFLFIALSVALHMWLGMQVIIEDYVHHEGLKVIALMGNTFFSIFVGVAACFAVLKISFGG
jgi:succinate dehydrogenase / fumarate reductase, membrane anchor subunit